MTNKYDEHHRDSFVDRLGRVNFDLRTGDNVINKNTGARGVIVLWQSLSQVLNRHDEASVAEFLERIRGEYDDINEYRLYFVMTNDLTAEIERGDIEPDNPS